MNKHSLINHATTDKPDAGMNTWWKYDALVACLILAALLRFYGLGDRAFWLDEIIQINLVLRAENLAHLLNLVASDPVYTTPPLLHAFSTCSLLLEKPGSRHGFRQPSSGC